MSDLNSLPLETTPIEDAWTLVRRPRSLFEGLKATQELNSWIVLKVIFVYVVLCWFAAWAGGHSELSQWNESVQPWLDEWSKQDQQMPFPDWMPPLWNPESLSLGFEKAWLAMAQIWLVVSPFLSIIGSLFSALGVWLMLPIIGVHEGRSFGKLFVSSMYAKWVVVLTVIPVFGITWWVGLAEGLLWILAVRTLHSVSFLRAFFVTYLLGWLLMGILAVGLAVLLALFLALLMGSFSSALAV
jgi:hypothetical protein